MDQKSPGKHSTEGEKNAREAVAEREGHMSDGERLGGITFLSLGICWNS